MSDLTNNLIDSQIITNDGVKYGSKTVPIESDKVNSMLTNNQMCSTISKNKIYKTF